MMHHVPPPGPTLPAVAGAVERGVTPSAQLEPHVPDALAVMGATLPGVSTVKVTDRHVVDRLGFGQPEIHGDSSLALLVDGEAPPVADIAACRAEVEAQ